MLKHAVLVGLRHVAVPVPHGYVRFDTEVGKAHELVVDECLKRAHIDGPDRCGRVFVEEREDGKERCLGLARGCGGRKQHVVVRVKDGLARCHLNGAQVLPFVLVNEVLDKWCVAVKDIHEHT